MSKSNKYFDIVKTKSGAVQIKNKIYEEELYYDHITVVCYDHSENTIKIIKNEAKDDYIKKIRNGFVYDLKLDKDKGKIKIYATNIKASKITTCEGYMNQPLIRYDPVNCNADNNEEYITDCLTSKWIPYPGVIMDENFYLEKWKVIWENKDMKYSYKGDVYKTPQECYILPHGAGELTETINSKTSIYNSGEKGFFMLGRRFGEFEVKDKKNNLIRKAFYCNDEELSDEALINYKIIFANTAKDIIDNYTRPKNLFKMKVNILTFSVPNLIVQSLKSLGDCAHDELRVSKFKLLRDEIKRAFAYISLLDEQIGYETYDLYDEVYSTYISEDSEIQGFLSNFDELMEQLVKEIEKAKETFVESILVFSLKIGIGKNGDKENEDLKKQIEAIKSSRKKFNKKLNKVNDRNMNPCDKDSKRDYVPTGMKFSEIVEWYGMNNIKPECYYSHEEALDNSYIEYMNNIDELYKKIVEIFDDQVKKIKMVEIVKIICGKDTNKEKKDKITQILKQEALEYGLETILGMLSTWTKSILENKNSIVLTMISDISIDFIELMANEDEENIDAIEAKIENILEKILREPKESISPDIKSEFQLN